MDPKPVPMDLGIPAPAPSSALFHFLVKSHTYNYYLLPGFPIKWLLPIIIIHIVLSVMDKI